MVGKSTDFKKRRSTRKRLRDRRSMHSLALIKSGEILRLKLYSGSCVSVVPVPYIDLDPGVPKS